MMAGALLGLIGTAASAPPAENDWVADVLAEQVDRHVAELALPEAPPLYHLRYHALRLGQIDLHTSFGSLVAFNFDPYGALGVEVRVGGPDLDNTGFGGWQDGFGRTGLPAELTPGALAAATWRLTDASYKEAVEQRARKVAQWTPPEEHPGDYTLTGPVTVDLGVARVSDNQAELTDLARALSARFTVAVASDTSVTMVGDAFVGHEAGALTLVDSEGSRVRLPVQETTIRVVGAVRASNGELLTDQRLWTVRDPGALPPQQALTDEVDTMRQELSAFVEASPMRDEYVGPVIFEGEAARALFRYVLIPQLEGTPPEVPFDSFFGDLGDDSDPVRLGRRVLPSGWAVVDDPTDNPSHPGSYPYDMEGSPAQSVDLVTDGIVRNVLMSRVPRRGQSGTNGHARGVVGSRLEGKAASMSVIPERRRSRRGLLKRGLRIAKEYGHDYVLWVGRLQEPAIVRFAGGGWFDESSQGTALPPPVGLYRVYADGRTELVRGASFASVQRWILRDIVAAGPQSEGSFMAPLIGGYASLGPTEGVATQLSVPDVLIGEVEVVPVPGDPRQVPVLPPPPH